jgi:hypothetical protein
MIRPTRDERFARENARLHLRAYLRQYDARLQHDVAAITAETARLRHLADRLHGRAFAHATSLSSAGR